MCTSVCSQEGTNACLISAQTSLGHSEAFGSAGIKVTIGKPHEIGSENKMYLSAVLSGFESSVSEYFTDPCAC